jgi:hypothetical protein
MKTEDEIIFPTSSSKIVRGDSSTAIRGGCVKKEEEEIRISNRRHHGDNNNMDCNDMNHDDLNRVRVQPVKKEEVEENDDDDHHENNETQTITPESIDDNYDDWGKGNWCWLLPANASANANISGMTRQSNCTNHSVKSDDGDTNNDTSSAIIGIVVAASSTASRNPRGIVRGRRSMPRDDEDDDSNGNNDDDDEKKPPKKKMRHCRPINDDIKEEVEEEEEEEDSIYETNNTTTNDNDNDSDIGSTSINSNNEEDDEEGYESWTEGNWCWVIPFPQAVLGKIETTRPSTTTTRRRRRRVIRNHNSSHQNSYEEDGSKCNNEDFNNADNDDADDLSSTKSKSRKGKIMRYKKLQNERWGEMFQRLVAYNKKHKSTSVPRNHQGHLKLGSWVNCQRCCYTNKELSVERIIRLDSIGFVWKLQERVPWEETYQRLVAYKKKHKSTSVPRNHQGHLKLANWVSHQRTYYNNKQLSTERTNLLESIGFVWAPDDVRWMEMYSKLIECKKQNKSTMVPIHCTEDPSFGNWVYTQRQVYNQGTLSGKRLKLLNSINFAWSAMKAS